MIKHHPSQELLAAFVDASLPVSFSAAIAMHIEMCPECAQKVQTLTDERALDSFENNKTASPDDIALAMDDIDLDAMIGEITEFDFIDDKPAKAPVVINIQGKPVTLPRAVSHLPMSSWLNLGKVSRARFELEEGDVRASLLNIEPGGSVPEHTHKGYEVTLLLSGSFSDDMGTYVAGDFITLDGNHTHQPTTEEGCLCFTISDNPQHFTQGINRLLNPFAHFLY